MSRVLHTAVGFVIFSLSLASSEASAQDQRHVETQHARGGAPFSMTLSLDRSTFFVGEGLVFDLSIVNDSKSAVVILGRQLRFHIEGEGARFIPKKPRPGPPIAPYVEAKVLKPGEIWNEHVVGQADTSGEWELPPGSYEISLRYAPTADMFVGYLGTDGVQWAGSTRSPGLGVRVEPLPPGRSREGEVPGQVEMTKSTPKPPATEDELLATLVADIVAGRDYKKTAARIAKGEERAIAAAFGALTVAQGRSQLDHAARQLHAVPDKERVATALAARLSAGGEGRLVLILNHMRAYNSPAVNDALIGALQDEDVDVSRAASEALGGSKVSEIRGALWKLVNDPTRPGSSYAVVPIASGLDPDVEAMLVNQFMKRDRVYKEETLRAMGMYGTGRILLWMVGVAKSDPDADIRAKALDALDMYARRQPEQKQKRVRR